MKETTKQFLIELKKVFDEVAESRQRIDIIQDNIDLEYYNDNDDNDDELIRSLHDLCYETSNELSEIEEYLSNYVDNDALEEAMPNGVVPKKLKYDEQTTKKAWDTFFKCINDKEQYNEHTQIGLSIQAAMWAVSNNMPYLFREYNIPDEEQARIYYSIYHSMMLESLRIISMFNINFIEKKK